MLLTFSALAGLLATVLTWVVIRAVDGTEWRLTPKLKGG